MPRRLLAAALASVIRAVGIEDDVGHKAPGPPGRAGWSPRAIPVDVPGGVLPERSRARTTTLGNRRRRRRSRSVGRASGYRCEERRTCSRKAASSKGSSRTAREHGGSRKSHRAWLHGSIRQTNVPLDRQHWSMGSGRADTSAEQGLGISIASRFGERRCDRLPEPGRGDDQGTAAGGSRLRRPLGQSTRTSRGTVIRWRASERRKSRAKRDGTHHFRSAGGNRRRFRSRRAGSGAPRRPL